MIINAFYRREESRNSRIREETYQADLNRLDSKCLLGHPSVLFSTYVSNLVHRLGLTANHRLYFGSQYITANRENSERVCGVRAIRHFILERPIMSTGAKEAPACSR